MPLNLQVRSKRISEMNRKEMLRLLLNQAQFNGFEFRHWFQSNVQPIWPGADHALSLLAGEGRHYTLLFSHEFARCFWRSGAKMRWSRLFGQFSPIFKWKFCFSV